MNDNECPALLSQLFSDLLEDLEFFKSRGIGLINASPLALGLLTNNVNPPDWHIAPLLVKEYVQKAAKLCKERSVDLGKCKKSANIYHFLLLCTIAQMVCKETIENLRKSSLKNG